MTIPEILAALERYTGKFPEAAMRAAVAQREAITPELLRVLQAVADDAPKYAGEEHYMAHMFALYLLAEFREKRAHPMLVKLISWPGKTADDLLGDTITEGLAGLLASTFDGDLEGLTRVALNEEANGFARSSVMDAMALLYLENLITREQLLDAFRRLYRELKEERDPQPWNGLVEATADAGLNELEPELRATVEKGLTEDDLEYLLERLSGPRMGVVNNFKYHRHLVGSAIDEMSGWAAFDQSDRPRPTTTTTPNRAPKAPKSHSVPPALRYALKQSPPQAAQPLPQFVESQPKIGRNDPCPCGSGKKYKKCCMNKMPT